MALVLWLFQSRRPSAPTPKSKYFNHVCPVVHVVYHHHCTTNSNPLFTITTLPPISPPHSASTLPPISLPYSTTASASISVSSNPTFSPFHFITTTTQTSVTTRQHMASKPTTTSIRAPRAGEYLGSNNINRHPRSDDLPSSTQPPSGRGSADSTAAFDQGRADTRGF